MREQHAFIEVCIGCGGEKHHNRSHCVPNVPGTEEEMLALVTQTEGLLSFHHSHQKSFIRTCYSPTFLPEKLMPQKRS